MSEIKDNNKRNDWQNPIYISYAWEDNKTEDNKTIENFPSFLKYVLKEERKYEVRFDKKDAHDSFTITEFEESIGRAEFVIVVLSDKYLHSQHCMNEWMKIHDHVRNYPPIYVFVDGSNKFDTTTFRVDVDELRKYWYNEALKFWNKIERLVDPSPIEEISNGYHFYYEEIGKIQSRLRNMINYKTSDRETALKDILDKLQEYINTEYAYDTVEERVRDVIFSSSNTVLLVGDSILRFKERPLGDVVNEELFKIIKTDKILYDGKCVYKDLLEWNRQFWCNLSNNQDVNKKNLLKSKIESVNNMFTWDFNDPKGLNSTLLDISLLNNLLNTNYFKLIITTGAYVNSVIMAKYAREKKNIRQILISNDGALKTESSAIRYKDSENDVVVFDLTKMSDNDSIVLFSELDVVNMVWNFIDVFKKNKNQMNKDIEEQYSDNSKILAVGTDLPGWALRFMWAAFYKHYSIVNNKPTDSKSINYLKACNVHILDHYKHIEHFVEKLVSLAKDNNVSTIDECTNIYIFYFNKDYKEFITFYCIKLKKIEEQHNLCQCFAKIHFVFNDKSEDIKKKITNSQHYLLFKFSNLTNDSNNVADLLNTNVEQQRFECIKEELKRDKQKKLGVLSTNKEDICEDLNPVYSCKYNDKTIENDISEFLKKL